MVVADEIRSRKLMMPTSLPKGFREKKRKGRKSAASTVT
jgi:hypothetical protein